ncbi:MAG: phage terminase large subunit [Bacteroidota bacterium]
MPLLRDERIRYIYIEGGSSAAKTSEVCSSLLIDQAEYNYSSMVFRRFHVNIKDSVFNSFQAASRRLSFDQNKIYTFQEDLAKCTYNSARVRFRGLDDEENVKGIEDYDLVYNNEWNQFTKSQWDQQRKRLRGRPNQKFICDWNPVSAKLWQYEEWLDIDEWVEMPLTIDAPTDYSSLNADFAFKRMNKKGNSVWIKVTYRDNFWVVGHPSGQGGYVDQHTLDDYEHDKLHNFNLYRVYANGERGILRTGGEFWKQFNETLHVKPLKVEQSTLHISLDENVMPYVTLACWQIIGKSLRQVHEIPCKQPDNNAPKSAKRLVEWLHKIDYKDVVYIYGDPSSSKRSTIDPNNSSFYEKFIEVLRAAGFKVVNRVARSAPEVALSAAFINEIYETNLYGWSITISDKCKVSVDDYGTVKEDKDGSMLKLKIKDKTTGQTYEPNGHFSDQKRYFIISVLHAEWLQYKQKQKTVLSASYFN